MTVAPEELKARTQPWLVPVSAQAPAGKPADFEPGFEEVNKEVEKLSALSGGKVDWEKVVSTGTLLLNQTSKDVRIAAYASFGLYATSGLDGLTAGLTGLAELLEAFWPTLFPPPARMKGRIAALQWLVERAALHLAAQKVSSGDRESVAALSTAVKRLSDVAREKYGKDCPAMGPLVDAVARLLASVPEPAATPAPTAATPVTQDAPATAALNVATPAPLGDPAETDAFLKRVGTSLVEAGSALRRASPSDATAYRILRTGLYLHLTAAPGANGKSQVRPLDDALRQKLDRLNANGRWVELLDEAESALPEFRLALDLHRYVAAALGGFGQTHRAARQAVVVEVGTLLRRMPELLELRAADGSPLVGAETRTWLDNEVVAAPAARQSGPSAGTEDAGAQDALAQARKMLEEGQVPDALALLQQRVTTAAGRARFLARLSLAQLCIQAGNKPLARALYEALDEECVARRLDDWEPSLTAACLEGLFSVVSGKEMGPELLAARVRRLAVVDPLAALRAIP